MFEVVFLGTSASAPSIKRGLSAMIIKHEEYRFLVDCGEGTQRQILRSGVGFKRLNHILLTHGHVAVDVVPLMVAGPMRRLLHLVGMLIALTFCAFFLWASVPWWWDTFLSGQTTPSIWRPRVVLWNRST